MQKGSLRQQQVEGIEGHYLRTTRKGIRSYYARLHWRQEGKRLTGWQSLKTDKNTIAKLRPKDVLAAHRRKVANPGATDNRDLTAAQLCALLVTSPDA